jgi:splicing factor 3B subunit 2
MEFYYEYRPTLSGTAPTTEQKSLYTVLSSKAASGSSKGFMSSTHTYSVPGSKAVEVTLNPEDLESGMDNETLKRKFEESVQESSKRRPAVGAGQREDFSELVNEHAEKQSKKKNRRDEKRDFKF